MLVYFRKNEVCLILTVNMPDLYLSLVILLMVLAVFGLIVGVSNDAVNFLNSAIGSRVAPRKMILIVASIGIFIGAASSDGMMEVARKGIFHPEAFSYADVMVIFVSVMLTNIILLDLFNTFGLPTSTTVSIVFSLLGSAVAMSLIKISEADLGLIHLPEYINWDNAVDIVEGILLSVVVAFSIGALVMYLSRLLFTFQIKKRMKWVGPLWGSLAMTALTWFLFTKGLKHAAFLAGPSEWVTENPLIMAGISFGFWAVVLKVITMVSKFNVLRIVVLFGTFSLAMAFAGNDLVNFIGVPVAGFNAYGQWIDSGQAADAYSMVALSKEVPTPWFLLLGSGLIMVLTLWLSKKARSVTETEVKLGRQDEGSERFSPNALSRGVVRLSRAVAFGFQKIMPDSLSEKINKNFEKQALESSVIGDSETPDFDLVRATVNVALASMIISYASALKLPLSTTYVSFMVAMGASLADQAWGRESAVFRVAGVFNVIVGWFGTAAAAFAAAAIFAAFIYFTGIVGVIVLVTLALGLIIRTSFLHKIREKKKADRNVYESDRSGLLEGDVKLHSADKASTTVHVLSEALQESIQGLLAEDLTKVRNSRKQIKALEEQNENVRHTLFHYLRRLSEEGKQAGRRYLRIFGLEQDIVQSAVFIIEGAADHVENVHAPLAKKQAKGMKKLLDMVVGFLEDSEKVLNPGPITEEERLAIRSHRDRVIAQSDALLDHQVKGVQKEKYGARNSLMFFSLVLEMRDLVNTVENLVTEFTFWTRPEDFEDLFNEAVRGISEDTDED